MTTAPYSCPLCKQKMARDLALFLDHTHQHVIDKIKDAHPEWVAQDGVCTPCQEYYEKQLTGDSINMGPGEVGKRKMVGILFAISTAGFAWWMLTVPVTGIWKSFIFIPIFISALGFLQAREKTCVVYSELGRRNLDKALTPISDDQIRDELKRRGRLLMLKSASIAAVLTSIFVLTPNISG